MPRSLPPSPSNPPLPLPLASRLIRRRTDRLRQLMALTRRLLQTNSGQFPTAIPAADPPDPLAVDSDVVVILCALICVVGLAAVARCSRSRSRSSDSTGASASGPAAAATDKGLKKKALKALPKLAYEDAVAAAVAARGGSVVGEEKILAECAICLSEFGEEEEIRVLPQCGHGFHVACVDTWLGAHSSCPSCRRVLVVDMPPNLPPNPKRYRKFEAMDEASSSSGAGGDRSAGFLA